MSSKELEPELPEVERNSPAAREENAPRPAHAQLRVVESKPQPQLLPESAVAIDKAKRPSIFRFKEFTIPPVLARERELRASLVDAPCRLESAEREATTPLARLPEAPAQMASGVASRRYGLLISMAAGIIFVVLLSALLDKNRGSDGARKTLTASVPAPSVKVVALAGAASAPAPQPSASPEAPSATRIDTRPIEHVRALSQPAPRRAEGRRVSPAPLETKPIQPPAPPKSSLPIDRERPF